MGILFDLMAPDGGIPASDMRASIEVCNLGSAVFGVTRAQSQLFRRDDQRVTRDGMDHILVQVFLEGGGLASSDHRISAGDMLIIDLDQPHEMLNTDFANLTMVLPRDLHPTLSGLLSTFHGRRLAADNPMVPFIAEHLCSLWQHIPDMNNDHAGLALSGTLGLLKGWLSHEVQIIWDAAPEVSMAISKSIFRYIERNLCETLTPEALSQTFRISRSQLYRIFAPHEGVARYVMERRLRRSLQMLSVPTHHDMNIGAIGFACGFSSESHFSRSFRNRFGISPSTARDLGREARSGSGVSDNDGNAIPPPFAAWIQNLGR